MATIPPHDATLYLDMQLLLNVWRTTSHSALQIAEQPLYDKPDPDKRRQLNELREQKYKTIELPF